MNSKNQSLWPAFSRMAAPFYSSIEMTFTRGEGAQLYDDKGKKYFDAFSTLWTNLVGHGREEIIEAIAEQSRKLSFMHLFTGSQHEPAQKLSQKLVSLFPLGLNHCFFGLSGSDATECALKMVRQYWFNKQRPQKNRIVARKSTYHGTSYGALSLMGHDDYQLPFSPLVGGMDRVSPNDFLELENHFRAVNAKETVAAVLVEPIITSDGLILPAPQYFEKLQALCKTNEVLLIVDEVSTGMGRVGEWSASTLFGLKPDIIYFAKGLTSGYLPLSAILTTSDIFQTINTATTYFMHGSTFAGHPASCVAALKVIEIIERERLLNRSLQLAEVLKNSLEKSLTDLEIVQSVQGMGMLFEITLQKFNSDKELELGMLIYKKLLEQGQYVRVLGRYLCIAPPLVSSEEDIQKMALALQTVLNEVRMEKGYWE